MIVVAELSTGDFTNDDPTLRNNVRTQCSSHKVAKQFKRVKMGDDVVSPKGFCKDDIRNGKFRGRSATKVSENMLRSRWSKPRFYGSSGSALPSRHRWTDHSDRRRPFSGREPVAPGSGISCRLPDLFDGLMQSIAPDARSGTQSTVRTAQ
jgi:hypothetical protein